MKHWAGVVGLKILWTVAVMSGKTFHGAFIMLMSWTRDWQEEEFK